MTAVETLAYFCLALLLGWVLHELRSDREKAALRRLCDMQQRMLSDYKQQVKFLSKLVDRYESEELEGLLQ